MTLVEAGGETGTTVVLDVVNVKPLESVVVYTTISFELEGEYGVTDVLDVIIVDPNESVVV